MKRISGIFLFGAFCVCAIVLRPFGLRLGGMMIIAIIIASIVRPVNALGNGVTVGNEFASFVFEEPGLGLREVSGLLENPEGEGKLWRIELRSRSGDVFSLDNTVECKTSYTKSEGKLDL